MSARWVWAGLAGLGLTVGIVVAADEAKMAIDQLPPRVLETLKALGAVQITEIEREKEHGIMLYEAEWTDADGHEVEAAVTAEGDLVEMEQAVNPDDVPESVKAVAAKEFGPGAKVSYEKVTLVVYELEAKANGREKEILVQPTGHILKKGMEADDDDDDDGDDEDDDGEQEEAVSLDQLPAAVKATILTEANGAKIHEIERETKNGQTVYEAEWKAGGQEVEIKVAADGTLLKKEVEADDDEGEDDDDN